jgi:hypothetical protein
MLRFAAWSVRLAALAALSLSGCCYYELRDCCDDCSMNIRNEYLARMAWHRCNDAYDDHPYKSEFGHGFRDGFAAVASGSDGCCPSIPPRCYWSSCYWGCDGQAAANAWFDGYARGAIAAEAEGLSASGRILVRPPACGANCQVRGPAMPASAVVTVPSPGAYSAPVVTPPPPAPPSMAPTLPANEAYESYDEGGLYYE